MVLRLQRGSARSYCRCRFDRVSRDFIRATEEDSEGSTLAGRRSAAGRHLDRDNLVVSGFECSCLIPSSTLDSRANVGGAFLVHHCPFSTGAFCCFHPEGAGSIGIILHLHLIDSRDAGAYTLTLDLRAVRGELIHAIERKGSTRF